MTRPKLLVTCERCGLQHTVVRAGRYRDEDFLELWHEHMALQALYKRKVRELETEVIDALTSWKEPVPHAKFDDEPQLEENPFA